MYVCIYVVLYWRRFIRTDGVRDYIARYIQAHPNLDPDAVNTCNFSLTPDPYAHFFKSSLGPVKCSP